jgi:autoinducer 2 (AI-2) kinase
MSERLTMAIDAGTGSCRAALFNEAGAQVGLAQREWSHAAAPGVAGSQVFDTDANWRLICECAREALDRARFPAEHVAAVAATSMREGMVLYDEAGREIWACPNVDSRASEEATELVRSGQARRIYGLAGDWVSITAPARFLWLKRHEPRLFDRIARVTMLSDWILFKLGGCHVTDPSVGSSSGMFDLARRTWSDEIVALCGVSREVFPKVEEPGTCVAALTRRAAAETGLKEGTPVVVGGADTQLGLVGLGAVDPGRFTVVGGTFWQHTLVLDRPLIDPQVRLRTHCHSVPGQWMIEGIGFYSGLALRWFRDAFCDWEKARAAERGVDPYVLLEEQAATVPCGANGVIGLFSNLMAARAWVHATPAFLQFDLNAPARSGRKECVRAIEESAAYVSRGHLRILEELTGTRVEEVVFTGGAAKGSLWPQILADTLGVVVRVPAVKESTALGAALYAGLGAGLYDDLGSVVRRAVRFERTYEPDRTAHRAYGELYEQWRQVYAHVLELSEIGLLRPLWRAAGAQANRDTAKGTSDAGSQ